MQISQLPYLDGHTTDVAADVDDVWPVLIETVDRAFSRHGAASVRHLLSGVRRRSEPSVRLRHGSGSGSGMRSAAFLGARPFLALARRLANPRARMMATTMAISSSATGPKGQ